VQLRAKPTAAIQLAEQIIDRGATMSLTEGIAEEFSRLPEVFATDEARARILAAAEAVTEHAATLPASQIDVDAAG
jgi:hypothetical protein